MRLRSGSIVSLRLLLIALILAACGPAPATASVAPTQTALPEWFDMPMTDVETGKTFTINDFSGKVVLLETMAMWCPNCLFQAGEVRKLHQLLGNPDDLVSISLDVDVNEDESSLKDYTEEYDFEWHFAVAPLGIARALGNLYTAEYLNPPLSPMMIIDRKGNVHHLEYGWKKADALAKSLQPYLNP